MKDCKSLSQASGGEARTDNILTVGELTECTNNDPKIIEEK